MFIISLFNGAYMSAVYEPICAVSDAKYAVSNHKCAVTKSIYAVNEMNYPQSSYSMRELVPL
jgi:hypothetical protein